MKKTLAQKVEPAQDEQTDNVEWVYYYEKLFTPANLIVTPTELQQWKDSVNRLSNELKKHGLTRKRFADLTARRQAYRNLIKLHE